jgi:hypothetical protein
MRQLGMLHQLVDSRVSAYKKLLGLHGRLDLLLDQARRRPAHAQTASDASM